MTKKKNYKNHPISGKSKNNNNVKKVTSKERNVKSKLKKKKIETNYSIDLISEALNAIGQGQTLREAADNFGIPKSTLYSKLKNLSSLDCRKGPSTVLTENEESEIAKWILFCVERGFPVSKSQLFDCVQKFITDVNRKTPFKDNRPGKHWYNAFMRRHSNLSKTIACNLKCTRASVTEDDLRGWFAYIQLYLKKKKLLSLHPARIFNLDKCSFMLVPKDNSVITEGDTRSVYQIVGGNEKGCLSVLFTVSACGKMVPPMILFDSKSIPRKNVLDKTSKSWGVGYTERGWTTAESFYTYITTVFFKWLKENEVEFPIVLYVDGNSSNVTLPLCKFCQENQIELVALYPNATHIIQPLDVALLHPLKNAYRRVLRQWRIDNNVIDFKKVMFPTVLELAIESMIDVDAIIKSGFRASGLYPFDANAVDYNILNKAKKTKTILPRDPNKTNDNNDENINSNNNYLQLLNLLEEKIISPTILEAFRKNKLKQSWSGELKHEELFECWRKMRRLCGI